jgi:hypothetical protein
MCWDFRHVRYVGIDVVILFHTYLFNIPEIRQAPGEIRAGAFETRWRVSVLVFCHGFWFRINNDRVFIYLLILSDSPQISFFWRYLDCWLVEIEMRRNDRERLNHISARAPTIKIRCVAMIGTLDKEQTKKLRQVTRGWTFSMV